MEQSEWEQEPDLGTGSTDQPSASDTDSESSSDSDKSDMFEEEEEEENMVEEETKSDQKHAEGQDETPWRLRQQENRIAAARRLPLLKTLFLRVQEGFHPSIQCSTRGYAEAKLLLRCLDCSPTLLFCSLCWLEQHGSVRTQHTPEVYVDGWRTVTHFLRSELPSPAGLIETCYPVCAASPAADLEGVTLLNQSFPSRMFVFIRTKEC